MTELALKIDYHDVNTTSSFCSQEAGTFVAHSKMAKTSIWD
jgi:hypothetical protein